MPFRSPLAVVAVSAVAALLVVASRSGPEEIPASQSPPAGPRGVSALGRLEPENGVRRIAGPSLASAVVRELLVDRGDCVHKDQLLATLDTAHVRAAAVRQIEAELNNAKREYGRTLELHKDGAESDSHRDEWRMRVTMLEARRDRAEAERRLTEVRSPIEGCVLDVHARAGERIGPEGILELGNTGAMFAIAEVYETDVGRVAVGQRARVTSPALAQPLTGVVERIRPKVAKQDALGTDPAARKDARVVEVEIRLDDGRAAAALTLVQVEVEIQ
jgi:HlyD family secretion protein